MINYVLFCSGIPPISVSIFRTMSITVGTIFGLVLFLSNFTF